MTTAIIKFFMLQDSSANAEAIDMQRLETLETENKALRSMIEKLEARVAALEVGGGAKQASTPAPPKVCNWYALFNLFLLNSLNCSQGTDYVLACFTLYPCHTMWA